MSGFCSKQYDASRLRFVLQSVIHTDPFYINSPKEALEAPMDVFFRRHFKRKESVFARPGGEGSEPCRSRRPSIAVPASRARRRSSAGFASATLAQRRRSSAQLQSLQSLQSLPHAASSRSTKISNARRRSSTTTPGANPRFAIRRSKASKLRNIDTHLLGPSMLLASLIQMTEEEEDVRNQAVGQVELKGSMSYVWSDPLLSEGDESDSPNSASDSDHDQYSEPCDEHHMEAGLPEQEFRYSSVLCQQNCLPLSVVVERVQAHTLIRVPRCLRRNSSCIGHAESGLQGRYCQRRRRRRVSTISKAGSPWPGRGQPLPSRRNSTCWKTHAAFSPLMGAYYDPSLESWSGFLSYVTLLLSFSPNDVLTDVFTVTGHTHSQIELTANLACSFCL